MAKRFIDTDVFKNSLTRSLEAPYKLLWIYLMCECDNAGIWSVEYDVAEIRLGIKLDGDPAAIFADRIHVFDDGKRWFIPDFIKFQYGELSADNRAHQSVIQKLADAGVLHLTATKKEAPCKPLVSPLQGAMDMDMDNNTIDTTYKKETNRERKGGAGGKTKAIDLIPEDWDKEEFAQYWADFERIRKSKKKQLTDIAVKRLVGSLVQFSGGRWVNAKPIMEKTIVGAWDAFYEPKVETTKQNGYVRPPANRGANL